VRPSWAEWYMGIARAAATRGDCTRRQVGAVLVRPNRSIAGVSYNGTAPGGPSCLKGECPRATSNVPPGSSYDTGKGICHAYHAELNVLALAHEDTTGYDVYVTAEPCDGCLKVMGAHRIRRVYWDANGMIVCQPLTRESK
jgi:dCMP deaminase